MNPGGVGKSVLRREDIPLLRGEGGFLADLRIGGDEVLQAHLLRSPIPHARILSIDSSRARAMPGVVAVLTASDLQLADERLICIDMLPDTLDARQYAMARDTVRYVGEAVALVVATDRALAEDAAECVEVRYEPLPAVASTAQALATDAAWVHPALQTNVVYQAQQLEGDVPAAFAAAHLVVEENFEFQRQVAMPLEPRGVIAAVSPDDGRLGIWSTSQIPHLARFAVATCLGLPPGSMRFVAPRLGGGFGLKEAVYPEEVILAAAALRLGRPLRWIEDRAEHFVASVHGREEQVSVAAAIDARGVFLALRLQCTTDIGSGFALVGNTPGMAMGALIRGPYRVPNIDARIRSVTTHKTPLNVLRGAGGPQATLVMERLMDLAAERLGIDRAEIRRRNLIQPWELPLDRGPTPFIGAGGANVIYDEADYPACLDMALSLGEYDDLEKDRASALRRGRLRGVGLSFFVEISASGPYENARLVLEPTGRLVLYSGIIPMGQGSETAQRQCVSQELGVDIESIDIHQGDTDEVPDAIGSFASRGAAVGGAVARLAARALRDSILDRLALQWRCEVSALVWDCGRVTGGPVEWNVATDRFDTLLEGRHRLDVKRPCYAYACHLAVVEIDPQTGRLEVPRYVVAHDCGVVINPMLVEGQIVGGVVQGLGQVLRERFHYAGDGRPLTGSLGDYVLPGVDDLPRDFRLGHLETPSSFNPFGMRGVGESGTIGVHGAIANAVADALGPQGRKLLGSGPFTPSFILALLADHR